MSGKKDFDGIFLGTTNGPQAVGLFKLSAAGVGWKNQATGEITTIPAADIKELKWLRVARGHRLRIGHNNSSVYMFDGFSKEAYDHLVSIGKEFYGKALDPVDVSIKGYNWGTVDFQSSTLSFNVAKKLAFEVPLTQVANTAVGGKNEVSIEFAPTSAPSAPGRRAQEDTLVEIRFFVPGMVTAGQVDEDDEGRRQFKDKKEDGDDDTIELTDGREEGEIPHEAQQVVYGDDGEALTAAALFCETIKQKADMGTIQGEAIVSFSELLCVTPRGRFVVDMHETFLRLRGKSHDYKILYTSIKRMFLLPKPDDLHYVFVIGLDPPVRQGQTRYPYLVFQFGREDEIEIDLSLSNELLETKYAGRLQKSYDGPLYEVVSDVFKGLTGRNVTKESLQYRSAHGQTGLKASQKANEAILYPLDKSFLSIPKPPIFFAFSEIAAVTFARVSSGSSSSTKTFEVRFSLNSGVEYTFSSISREEHGPLESFCIEKKLPIRNEIADEGPGYRMNDDDEDDGDESDSNGRSKRARGAASGGGDDGDGDGDEDSSEDEDFEAESESDVGEEFSEDYQSSGDEDAGGNDSSSKKKRKSKRRDDSDGEGDDEVEEPAAAPAKKAKSSESGDAKGRSAAGSGAGAGSAAGAAKAKGKAKPAASTGAGAKGAKSSEFVDSDDD